MKRSYDSGNWYIYLILVLFCFPAMADWPTYRHDNQRSASTTETIKLPLNLAWNHKPVAEPTRAWGAPKHRNQAAKANNLISTLDFDSAFHPIIANGRIYFASSSTDTVYCLSSSGKLLWQFTTEAPVRLSPVYADKKIFVGSDDGYIYCLEAESGQLIWRYLAGPSDRRIPGNGRVISQWPVRGGFVIENQHLYYCVGIFPSQGVFIGALNTESGKSLWKKPVSAPPQGHLLCNKEQLFVPTGRTPFRSFSKSNGAPVTKLGKSTSWGRRLHGGCFGTVIDNKLVSGPSEDGHLDIFSGKTNVARVPGLQLIADEDKTYLLTKSSLQLVDRAKLSSPKKKRRQPTIVPIWEVKFSDAHCMVRTPDLIFVGGANWIMGVSTATGKELWNQPINGTVASIAITENTLIAATEDGGIHCFKTGTQQTPLLHSQSPAKQTYPLDKATLEMHTLAGTEKGYILVLGLISGKRLAEIARNTNCRVIGRDPNAARVESARKLLKEQGLYGVRAVVHHGSLSQLPYTHYFANIITTENDTLNADHKETLRVLRPHGGLLYLPETKGTTTELNKTFPGSTRSKTGAFTWIRPKLKGAGEWSHFYADPANTACSNDELKKGPLKVQWFGEPGPEKMIDRHNKPGAPLYKSGRLFVPGLNHFFAIDAYNGTLLWEKEIPDSARIGAMNDSSNMAIGDEHMLIAAGEHCLCINPQTGVETRRISVVDLFKEENANWAYLATVDKLIYGSTTPKAAIVRKEQTNTKIWRQSKPLVVCSNRVFAVQQNGKLQWNYKSTGMIINPTITIANGRVHFVESEAPEALTTKNGQLPFGTLLKKANLVALDANTGALIWKRSIDLGFVTDALYLSSGIDTLIITGSHYREVSAEERRGRIKPNQAKRARYEVYAFDCAKGAPLWQRLLTPNRDHELKGGHGATIQHPAIVGDTVYGPGFAFTIRTGKDIDGWKWEVGPKCGTVSTSKHVAFSRFSSKKYSYIFDLKSGKNEPLSSVARPGCWINIIPAGGLILVPESSAGCTCEYGVQASISFLPTE